MAPNGMTDAGLFAWFMTEEDVFPYEMPDLNEYMPIAAKEFYKLNKLKMENKIQTFIVGNLIIDCRPLSKSLLLLKEYEPIGKNHIIKDILKYPGITLSTEIMDTPNITLMTWYPFSYNGYSFLKLAYERHTSPIPFNEDERQKLLNEFKTTINRLMTVKEDTAIKIGDLFFNKFELMQVVYVCNLQPKVIMPDAEYVLLAARSFGRRERYIMGYDPYIRTDESNGSKSIVFARQTIVDGKIHYEIFKV